MKNYYILTNRLEIKYVGEFENFSEAWEYIDYSMQAPFVWLFKEENLLGLIDTIKKSVKENKENANNC